MNWKPISELTEEHKDSRLLLFSNGEHFSGYDIKRFGVFDKNKEEGLFDVDFEHGEKFPDDFDYKYFLEIPALPKPQFIIAEKDVGRKVETVNCKTGIIFAYKEDEQFGVYVGMNNGDVLNYNKFGEMYHPGFCKIVKDITGWADE